MCDQEERISPQNEGWCFLALKAEMNILTPTFDIVSSSHLLWQQTHCVLWDTQVTGLNFLLWQQKVGLTYVWSVLAWASADPATPKEKSQLTFITAGFIMLQRMCTVSLLFEQTGQLGPDRCFNPQRSFIYTDVPHSPPFCDGLCTPFQNSLLLSGWDGHKPGQRALYQETVAETRKRKWQTQVRVKISNGTPWHHFRSGFCDYLEGRRFNRNQNGPKCRVSIISM